MKLSARNPLKGKIVSVIKGRRRAARNQRHRRRAPGDAGGISDTAHAAALHHTLVATARDVIKIEVT